MSHKHHIKLKTDVVPYLLTTPRRVSLPLRSKVKAELQGMESLGVISKVREPPDWCSGMVVVPNPNCRISIFIN